MPKFFDADRYPGLLKHAQTRRGAATLLSVSETSDGFLTGWAEFEDADGVTHEHSVFLGAVADFKKD